MIYRRLSRAVTLAAAAATVGLAAAPAIAAASGTFTPTGSMNAGHTHGRATLLPTGNVLVADGLVGLVSNPQTTAGAMLYHPGTNTWTGTGSMTTGREGQTATLLPDGQVLMAGGTLFDHPSAGHPGVFEVLASAELYTP